MQYLPLLTMALHETGTEDPLRRSMTRRAFLSRILSEGAAVREVRPGLLSALPPETPEAPYDRRAALYDAVVGRSLYHRIFWGTSTGDYRRIAREAIDAARDGTFAEAACGSLLFTAHLHRDTAGPPTLLVDRSLRMLQRGMKRLRAGRAAPREDVVLLHGDVASLPIRPRTFTSILSLNLLHVRCDARAIVEELGRVLASGEGRLFLTCLVRSGRWSDAYLAALHRAGEFAAPWDLEALHHLATGSWAAIDSSTVKGNMCFLVLRHAR